MIKLDGNIYSDKVTNTLYSTDASMFRVMPKYVVEPKSYDDISKVLRFAKDNSLPVAARGAGTGLAGESLSDGIVIDTSLFFDKIISIDRDNKTVIVQAGVVQSQLNEELKKYGLIFGPDPATSNRCTLGGMIANNSTGAHSLRYGMTSDWVESLKVALHDGSIVEVGRIKIEELQRDDLKEVAKLVLDHTDLIIEKWPSTPRNRHGYLLNKVIDGEYINLHQLFLGSEGTLGVILEATLKVAELPSYKKLLCLSFDSLGDAANAASPLLKYNPAAVEIIDSVCLEMARSNDVYSDIFDESINTILMVEIDGNDKDEICGKVEKIKTEFVGKLATSILVPEDDVMQNTIWQMRKLIAGMINKVPGRFQPIPVIEDVCVDPSKLAEYFEGVEEILSKKGIKFLAFGHAGDGTVHIRPFLDNKSSETFNWLPDVCDKIYEMTLQLGGTISGEHGDGYLRAPFIQKQYGELFDVFTKLKDILDPYKILNPDKLTGCRDFTRWEENRRFSPKREFSPMLNWNGKKIEEVIEACNGCGECRSKIKERDMCPVFKALGVEAASTRSKANIMRSLLYGELDGVSDYELRSVVDLCIYCKRCADDCPSGVKAGDLMLELKAKRKLSFDERALCTMEKAMSIGSCFPRISNFISSLHITRNLLQAIFKIDSRRNPPRFSTGKKIKGCSGTKDKVVYFVDTFAKIMDGNVAKSFIDVCKHHDIEVIIPKQLGSGIVNMNYGDIKSVEKLALENCKVLADYVRKGYRIVCTEPSAALMLKEEYLMVVKNDDAELVSKNTTEAMSYLTELHEQGRLITNFEPLDIKIGYHAPCHLKNFSDPMNTINLLNLIPDVTAEHINKGCCGIAGTYGMRTKGYDTSMLIASDLKKCLEKESIDIGVTECSTCSLQMNHLSAEKKTVHPLEILATGYGL